MAFLVWIGALWLERVILPDTPWFPIATLIVAALILFRKDIERKLPPLALSLTPRRLTNAPTELIQGFDGVGPTIGDQHNALNARREAWRQLESDFKNNTRQSIWLDWQSRGDGRRVWSIRGHHSEAELEAVRALLSLAGQRVIESPALARAFASKVDVFGNDPERLWFELLQLKIGDDRIEYGKEDGLRIRGTGLFWSYK